MKKKNINRFPSNKWKQVNIIATECQVLWWALYTVITWFSLTSPTLHNHIRRRLKLQIGLEALRGSISDWRTGKRASPGVQGWEQAWWAPVAFVLGPSKSPHPTWPAGCPCLWCPVPLGMSVCRQLLHQHLSSPLPAVMERLKMDGVWCCHSLAASIGQVSLDWAEPQLPQQ